MSCQSRNGDINELFAHENQSSPPSLSQCGEFKIDKTKADLLVCLDDLTKQNPQNAPQVTCQILDGAGIVKNKFPGAAAKFINYSQDICYPYIKSLNCNMVDIVFDEYI